jgi:hypothetical protein
MHHVSFAVLGRDPCLILLSLGQYLNVLSPGNADSVRKKGRTQVSRGPGISNLRN